MRHGWAETCEVEFWWAEHLSRALPFAEKIEVHAFMLRWGAEE
jgi:hypothetical protein